MILKDGGGTKSGALTSMLEHDSCSPVDSESCCKSKYHHGHVEDDGSNKFGRDVH